MLPKSHIKYCWLGTIPGSWLFPNVPKSGAIVLTDFFYPKCEWIRLSRLWSTTAFGRDWQQQSKVLFYRCLWLGLIVRCCWSLYPKKRGVRYRRRLLQGHFPPFLHLIPRYRRPPPARLPQELTRSMPFLRNLHWGCHLLTIRGRSRHWGCRRTGWRGINFRIWTGRVVLSLFVRRWASCRGGSVWLCWFLPRGWTCKWLSFGRLVDLWDLHWGLSGRGRRPRRCKGVLIVRLLRSGFRRGSGILFDLGIPRGGVATGMWVTAILAFGWGGGRRGSLRFTSRSRVGRLTAWFMSAWRQYIRIS